MANRFELGDITLALANTSIRQGLYPAVSDWHSGKRQGHLDDELENVGKGKESKVGICGDEKLIQELPD